MFLSKSKNLFLPVVNFINKLGDLILLCLEKIGSFLILSVLIIINLFKWYFLELKHKIYNKKKKIHIEKIKPSLDINYSIKTLPQETKIKQKLTTKQILEKYLQYQHDFQIKIKKRFQLEAIILSFFLIILIIQTIIIFTFNNNKVDTGLAMETRSLNNQNRIEYNNDIGTRILDNFQNHSSLIEFGGKIEIGKNKIKTINHTNCKTPILPPIENGCYFVISPNNINIPDKGLIFKNIIFDAQLSGDSQIEIELKNYNSGKITSKIGTIKSTTVDKKLILPENISKSEGLFITLWQKSSEIIINKIIFEYLSTDMLIPVSGKIQNWKQDKNLLANIILDNNENKKYDLKIDQNWNCRNSFPGVKSIEIDIDGGFVIKRDDQCYIGYKPDSWFTDNNKNSLPPGMWLLHIPDINTSYSFEIKNGETQKVLEI